MPDQTSKNCKIGHDQICKTNNLTVFPNNRQYNNTVFDICCSKKTEKSKSNK